MKLPLLPKQLGNKPLGTIHFIGIGGIGMSAIAEILHGMGYPVRGSDVAENGNIQRLREKGIPVNIGQDAAHVEGAGAVVLSTAIKIDNPEWAAARAAHIPCVHRAEMLAELMRVSHSVAVSGSHGKTTTTSLVFSLLMQGGFDPSVINGGIINAHGSNARIGQGEWMVVEADESDGSFTRLRPTLAVVTNIEAEHMSHFGNVENLHAAFYQFAENVPFYGAVVACVDDAGSKALATAVTNRRVITYGLDEAADVRAINIRPQGLATQFDVWVGDDVATDLTLNLPGVHNVRNALAAIACARELGIEWAAIREALATFGGVGRRFSEVGNSHDIRVIDDYAHHPTEIAATLQTARQVFSGRVYAVVQPHRYSRLRDHFADFATCAHGVDGVFVAPVYAAGEAPLEAFNSQTLAAAMGSTQTACEIASVEALAQTLLPKLQAGDGVVFLGAGSITQWAQQFAALLAKQK